MNSSESWRPVIIIGAPRSGTNMLRDILVSTGAAGTWHCDEIDAIWRHGNLNYPDDELPAERATPAVRAFIRRRFEAIHRRQGVSHVVEKTCANTLRVPFVERVFPDALYLYIYRDGIDAAGSARMRWRAPMDLGYTLRKARYVPLADLPWYGARFLRNRLFRLLSKDDRVALWGPKFSGMEALLEERTLNEVCALQWSRCVSRAESGFASIPADRVFRIRYEDFVRDPVRGMRAVFDFLGIEVPPDEIEQITRGVSSASIGKGRDALGGEEVQKLEQLVEEDLRAYGYLP